MELAREVVLGAARIGVLANLSDAKAPPQLQELEAAGQKLGVRAPQLSHKTFPSLA
jgi:hypothetical protein